MASSDDQLGIAIIGMSGRFPGASNIETFWRNLANGVDSISHFTEEEQEHSLAAKARKAQRKGHFVPARGILENVEYFDAGFFGILPREAELMDPQHRVFLECSWEALESAGYDPEQYPGAIGIFGGASFNTYFLKNICAGRGYIEGITGNFQTAEWPTILGNDEDFLATRVAYKLNLRGPAITVQTACSTSLVAVCQACTNLLGFQCDMALAGGVSITFPQKRDYAYQEEGMASPDGICRTFDADAQGTVFSHGAGVVLLKRLADAIADGDNIIATIKGFAVNNDGSGKAGFMAPSVEGQAEVIAMAQTLADFHPESIGYIEAHGTATPLGDPIEVDALTQIFQAWTQARGFCGIGSVKPNIGHLETAAGVAGLIKTALVLKKELIPASIHFSKPNPKIDFAASPFYVVDKSTPWKSNGKPRRAGVTSLGVGGTNAHVVLEEAVVFEPTQSPHPQQLLVLSARSGAALQQMATNLATHLNENADLGIADVAHTLQIGRRPFRHRKALVARDTTEAIAKLLATDSKSTTTGAAAASAPSVVFLFPGQGSQYVDMGRGLYDTEPVFRAEVDRCAEILIGHIGVDIRQTLYPDEAGRAAAQLRINQTAITQPCIFIIEYALARLWQSWGIQPAALIGHSIGEYVAAVIAETFTLEDALALLAQRAQLMQALPPGSMMAVRLGAGELEKELPAGAAIAAINSPSLTTVSGPPDVIDVWQKQLDARAIAARLLPTSHAFHSPMMEPIVAPFTEIVRRVKAHTPKIPWVSTCTGSWITDADLAEPGYWARQLRREVRFAAALEKVITKPDHALLEVGPGQALTQLARQHAAKPAAIVLLTSIGATAETSQDITSMLTALGRLWTIGATPDWKSLHQNAQNRRVPLPTYPFERKRYWIEPPVSNQEEETQRNTPAPFVAAAKSSTDAADQAIVTAAHDSNASSAPSLHEELATVVQVLFSKLSGTDAPDLSASFIELGADSLFLSQFSQAIEKRFATKITFRQLMNELPNLTALASFLEQRLPAPDSHEQIESTNESVPLPVPAPTLAPIGGAPTFEMVEPSTRRLADCKNPSSASVETSTATPVKSYPLLAITEGQSEIWLAMQLAPEMACAYNDVLIVSIRGPLDAASLHASLRDLVNRHEALRITFTKDGKSQRIAQHLVVDTPSVDLSSLKRAEQDERIQETARHEDGTPFNLETGPLIRLHLFKRGPSEHTLLLAYHHLIVDGWSAGVLVRDLAALYVAHSQNLAPALPPPMQFSDYVAWQTQPAQIAAAAKAEQYWLELFADLPTAIELPRDRARSNHHNYRSGYKAVDLDAALCRRFRKTAARANSTVFNSLCATFIAWLHRVTGQNDIVIGVPNSGQSSEALRPLPGSSELVGHCVDFLPIRVHCTGDMPFNEHTSNVRNRILDAKENQSYTLGSLVKKLNVPRDSNRAPLIPVIFNFIPFTNEVKQASGIEWLAEYNGKGFSLFDLVVFVTARGPELRINCEYRTDFYAPATIDRWLAGLRTLIESVADASDKRIEELEVLAPAERHLLFDEWNATQRDYRRDACLHQLFETQAAQSPDAVAVIFEDQSLTYRELNGRADALAVYLRSIGVGPDELVGLCVQRSLEMVVGILGILKAGGAYVPIDPTYPADRIAFVLEDAQALALLTQRSLLPDLPDTAAQRIFIDEPLPTVVEPQTKLPAPSASNLAYVIYTSGSTGKPKGVQIEHRAVVNFLNSMRRKPGLTAKDTVLAVTTLSFDIAGLELHLPLTSGARVVIAPWQTAVDGSSLIRTIQQHHVTLLQATPVTWRLLLAAGWQGTPDMKILCGGEPLPPELARELIPRCSELWNMYGPTETTIWSTCCRVTDAANITIGTPIDNTTIYILDSHSVPVPIGSPGELLIGGDGLARSYLKRPELTSEKFIAHPTFKNQRLYRTGDLARYRANGDIECLGRLDFQVKLRGFRIELGEIETVLTHHPQVRQAVVIAREDSPGDKRLVAYLSTRPGKSLSIDEIREHARGKLPDYMRPAAFVVLDTFPLTPNGKIDRKQLPLPSTDDLQPSHHDDPPANVIEERLAAIWCRILNVPSVGRHQSFFELGGNSLLAVSVFAEIEKEFERQLPLAVLFDHPTVASLAVQLSTGNESNHPWPSLVPINSKGTKQRFYCVHGAGGNILLYRNLAERMGDDYPFYGIQSRGLDGKLPPLGTIEDMASYYVNELQRMQPHGPYCLGGYCLGGAIALEMARQLVSKGEHVPLIAMLDSYNPAAAIKTSWTRDVAERLSFHLRNFLSLKPAEMKSYIIEKVRVARDGEFKKVLNLATNKPARPAKKHATNGDTALQNIQAINDHAIDQYKPEPYAGTMTLFKPRINYSAYPDPLMGWEKIAQNGVEVVELPVNPHAMLVEPFVQLLAAALQVKLNEAQASTNIKNQ